MLRLLCGVLELGPPESCSGWGLLGDLWEPAHLPGEGNGTPFQYSCLENPMDGGAWKIPRVEEPGGLQSMGSLGVGHD